MDVIGVVLGGGEGRRFGGDKLLALVDGYTSIERVANTLRAAGAHSVYVLTRSEYRCKLYVGLAGLDGCLYDQPGSCQGPGFALASLSRLDAKYILVAPGDAPWLSPSIYETLLGFLGTCDIAAPLHGNGFIETLVHVVRGSFAKEMRHIAETICSLRGDVRPSDYIRFASCSVLVGSLLLGVASPSLFAHINIKEALRTRMARNPLGDKVVIELRPKKQLIEMMNREKLCKHLLNEIMVYSRRSLTHLARHAKRDYESLCTRRAKDSE